MFYNQHKVSVLFGVDGYKMLEADPRHKENATLFDVVDRRYPPVATHRDMYYMTQRFAQKMQAGQVEELVPLNTVVKNSAKAMTKHYLTTWRLNYAKDIIEEIGDGNGSSK